jgi:hypothetical protein
MLELPWYVRHVVERYGLPMPFSSDSLDSFRSYKDSTGNSVTLSSAVFHQWRNLAIEGRLPRPLVAGLTSGLPLAIKGEYRIEGPFARVLRKGERASELVDTAMVNASLVQLSGASFLGPVSPQDRSPLRRSSSGSPRWVPLYLASLQGQALVKAGAIDAAKQQLAWMERFGYDVGLDSNAVAKWVQPLKKSLP